MLQRTITLLIRGGMQSLSGWALKVETQLLELPVMGLNTLKKIASILYPIKSKNLCLMT
jgi:hypothetical protein